MLLIYVYRINNAVKTSLCAFVFQHRVLHSSVFFFCCCCYFALWFYSSTFINYYFHVTRFSGRTQHCCYYFRSWHFCWMRCNFMYFCCKIFCIVGKLQVCYLLLFWRQRIICYAKCVWKIVPKLTLNSHIKKIRNTDGHISHNCLTFSSINVNFFIYN